MVESSVEEWLMVILEIEEAMEIEVVVVVVLGAEVQVMEGGVLMTPVVAEVGQAAAGVQMVAEVVAVVGLLMEAMVAAVLEVLTLAVVVGVLPEAGVVEGVVLTEAVVEEGEVGMGEHREGT